MRLKYLALAAGALLLSASAASAAVVINPLHLRTGPSINNRVITTMPAGDHVNINYCTSGWCRVWFRGQSGWAAANYLGRSYPRYGSYYGPGYDAYAAVPSNGYYNNDLDFGFGPLRFGIGYNPDWD